MNPLPPVGATVVVHDHNHGDVPCVVTESPTPHGIGFDSYRSVDEHRRISVRGAEDAAYRREYIIARDEDRFGALITYSAVES